MVRQVVDLTKIHKMRVIKNNYKSEITVAILINGCYLFISVKA